MIKLSIIKIVNYFVKTKCNTFVYKSKSKSIWCTTCSEHMSNLSIFFVSLLCIMYCCLKFFVFVRVPDYVFLYIRVSIIPIINTFVFESICIYETRNTIHKTRRFCLSTSQLYNRRSENLSGKNTRHINYFRIMLF